MDEVLCRQPEPQQRLLIETSFLDEVTGPLADAVTGLSGCGEMLADLARDNSFVIPLDAAQASYRYHQLFREILRYLLQRRSRHAVPALQARAAAWFESVGDLGNAVYWSAQAGDRAHVAALLARGGFVHAFVHRQDLSGVGLRELLPLRLPKGAGAVRAAEFAVASSVIEAVFADAESAADGLRRLPAVKADEVLADTDLLVTSDLVELVLGQKACDLRMADSAASRLLRRSGDMSAPAVPGLRAAVLLAQASTHLWHGRHEDIGALLEEALAEAVRDELPALELEVLAMIAFVDSYWSRTNRADDAVQRAHALRRHKNLATPPVLELAAALRALVAGDLGGWAQALQRILLSDVVGSDPGIAVAIVVGRASVLLGRGQVNQARTLLQEAGHRIPPVLAVQRDILLADLDTSMGRPRAALRLLRNYQDGEFAVLTAVPRARACLALGDLRGAQECVRTALTAASPQASRFLLVDAMLCDAQVAQLSDDPARAIAMLIRALEIARGEIVLPFVHAKDVFAALLARHPAVAARWPVPRPDTLADPSSGDRLMISGDLPEPLTQRELTVLRYLPTDMSAVEIADELCLSVNTVKTHMAAIYRKLPAHRRREAVHRARQLELI